MRMKYSNQGFTLLELLVTLVLVSVVTLITAMALKLAIESWNRGEQEGESTQLIVALPALMEKQLKSMVKAGPFQNAAESRVMPFCGRKNGVSFLTSYAPQGSPFQGLLRITYLFKEEEKTLYLYERIITTEEDLKEEFDPLSERWDGSFDPMGKVNGITDFALTYSGERRKASQETDAWKETWESVSGDLPAALGLRLEAGAGLQPKTRNWYFQLGGLAL